MYLYKTNGVMKLQNIIFAVADSNLVHKESSAPGLASTMLNAIGSPLAENKNYGMASEHL